MNKPKFTIAEFPTQIEKGELMKKGPRTALKKQELWNEICKQLNIPVNPAWYSTGSNVEAWAFDAALKKIGEKTGIPPSYLSEKENKIWRMLHKSKHAMLSAIHAINDPTAIYRLELFLFLFINAWELLLKAKVIMNNGESALYDKSGEHTITITTAITQIFNKEKDPIAINLFLINDLRNDVAHHVVPITPANIITVLQAGIRNYESKLKEWFNKSLSDELPFGMISIVSNIDKTIFDIDNALLNNSITKDTANMLNQWGKTFEKQMDIVEGAGGEMVQLAIPIRFNLAVVKDVSKASILASISETKESLVAIRYQKPTDRWKLTYTQLRQLIQKTIPITKKDLDDLIKQYKIKGNEMYSGYNFATNEKETEYLRTGKLPSSGYTPIYNHNAAAFLIERYKEKTTC
ncbi:MAG: DUF3644 domain-containing protein [Prevotellaceae bacterium]|nr:DUF3644 domain-containing protein [Prevotellaceae bacterium]